jgi:hypothetical protein
MARAALAHIPSGDPERGRLHEAAVLLERLLLQDIERGEDGTRLKQGVNPDRVVSVHDPQMRHGRKSERRRFDGHKAHLAVDPESRLITAVEVLAGNAADHERALRLVEQSEANAETVVEEVVGDCAYGDGNTRKTFAEAGRNLVAKVASRRAISKGRLPARSRVHELRKSRGPKDTEGGFDQFRRSLRCAGHPLASISFRRRRLRRMSVAAQVRAGAPRERSFGHDPPAGDLAAGGEVVPEKRGFRAVSQTTAEAAEHRLARMMQLGVGQARYFGRTKTLFQLLIAATVANLTLVARRVGLMRDRNHLPDGSLYTRLRLICVSLRVRNSVATLGGRVFGHASRGSLENWCCATRPCFLRDNAPVCAELEACSSQDQTSATSSRSSMHEISTHIVNRVRRRAEAARPRPSPLRGRYPLRRTHSRRLPISFTSLLSINFSTFSANRGRNTADERIRTAYPCSSYEG